MTKEVKDFIIDALNRVRGGHDLYMAEREFEGKDLTQQHGQSGSTRQQILDAYRAQAARADAAIAAMRAL